MLARPNFRKMYVRKLKCTIVLISTFAVCYIYYFLNEQSWSWYLHSAEKNIRCQTPIEEMRDLIQLTRDTHIILDSYNLTHFPIYGSLFGALRYQDPLPWDTDVDLFLSAEELDNIDEDKLLRDFKAKGIEIFYRPWFGAYRITRGRSRGDLMIFKNYSGTMNRVGMESYAFFVNYRKHHIFPAHLIKKPLPTLKFCGIQMLAPRGGIELQKYHYRNDWWLEKKPNGCYNASEYKKLKKDE